MKKLYSLLSIAALGALMTLPVAVSGQRGNAAANQASQGGLGALNAEQAVMRSLNHLGGRGIAAGQVRAKDFISDATGNHVRFSQVISGVRVYGYELITHERANGRFSEATGQLFDGRVITTIPAWSNGAAISAARQVFGHDAEADAELIIYPEEPGAWLAYAVDIKNTNEEPDEPRREMIIIDALTGAIIDSWDNLQTTGTSGTGYGFYSGEVVNLPIDLTSGTHYMFDVPNNGKTTDYSNKTCPFFGCRSTGTVYSSTDNIFGTAGALSDRQSIGVDAHFFAQQTLGYFWSAFNRNGIDNNNNKSLKWKYMLSRTHYGSKYNNAFWDGASMTYGDGDGTTYRPFDAVDVVGHEMTHGITERTSNLEYKNESGAANESFSDIFGAVIEFKVGTRTGFGGVSYPSDWWIGEDLYYSNNPSSPTRGIRNMADTHVEGDPDHYTERYTGTGDNGGVHTNSGIQNYLFYLLVSGGQNHKDVELNGLSATTVTGIGLDAAAAIAWDADTKYCTATDTYAKVANAWVDAAKARYGAGSTQAQQTYNAWKSAGITPTVSPTVTS